MKESRSSENSETTKMSYANRLKTNVNFSQRLKRNVLEITLERPNKEVDMDVDPEEISRVFRNKY